MRLPPQPSGAMVTLSLKSQAVSQAALRGAQATPRISPLPFPGQRMGVEVPVPEATLEPQVTKPPPSEEAWTQPSRKRKGRACQITPQHASEAATETSPDTATRVTQTPLARTMDATMSAFQPLTGPSSRGPRLPPSGMGGTP